MVMRPVLVVMAPLIALWEYLCELLIWFFYLKGFRVGCFDLTYPDGTQELYGDPTSSFRGVIVVHSRKAFARMVTGETIGMADAYMNGEWDSPDLARMVEVVAENVKARAPVGPPFQAATAQLEGFMRWVHANNPINSLRNVQAHYDIGNEMYKLMLDDETMSYTCALFRDPSLQGFVQHPDDGYKHISLGQAQLNKIHYIIRKAGLTAEDTVAELGCGWGGFAIEAAATTGCRITSYNLSIEQIKYAREKAARRGVDHLVTFVHADYRTVWTTFSMLDCSPGPAKPFLCSQATGPVDKVVSIGMFEHVGDKYFASFFQFVESCVRHSHLLLPAARTAH